MGGSAIGHGKMARDRAAIGGIAKSDTDGKKSGCVMHSDSRIRWAEVGLPTYKDIKVLNI
jgi:hypothetical protein